MKALLLFAAMATFATSTLAGVEQRVADLDAREDHVEDEQTDQNEPLAVWGSPSDSLRALDSTRRRAEYRGPYTGSNPVRVTDRFRGR